MGWIGITGKVLVFTGRLAQAEGLKEWLESVASEKAQAWAQERGIKFFKKRSARKAWWEELRQAASSGPLRTLLDNEAHFYQELPGHLANSNSYVMSEGLFPKVSMVPRFQRGDTYNTARPTTHSLIESKVQCRRFASGQLNRYAVISVFSHICLE